MKRGTLYLMCDFETTVYEGQDSTEVWAAACVELFTEDVKIFHSINEQWAYFVSLNKPIIAYYHNLKFDGAFWLDYFINTLHLEQAYTDVDGTGINIKWLADKEMPNNSFKYTISYMGQWYSIKIKINNKLIEIRDSLKLLPFSVKEIGNSFGTKRKKTSIEYKGRRYAGCPITDIEKQYIANDVLVVAEALEIMFKDGHDRLTIGACCLSEFKTGYTKEDYKRLFPDLTSVSFSHFNNAEINADAYIRKSYKGGWCYLVPDKANIVFHDGITLDVNSLYPSMMSSESGNYYPTGYPEFWEGTLYPHVIGEAIENHTLPKDEYSNVYYYFIKIRTRFKLKADFLPCIQIKGNFLYRGNEWLTTSDVYSKELGGYFDKYIDISGVVRDAKVELTLTMTDWELIQEHYDLIDCEILGGCYFRAEIGLFDEYINKYRKIKMESKGAKRTSAKLFLNNLYGKLAANTDSSFKVAYVKEDGVIGFYTIEEHDKSPGYIPIGSAITSYARNFTIRAAQCNYHGNAPGFIYADTDSLHLNISLDDVKGVMTDSVNFCCWKHESSWKEAIFVRQKTYIEQIIDNGNLYYDIKCAGMPETSKKLFEYSMVGLPDDVADDMTENNKNWILSNPHTLNDFKVGLTVPGKLMPKRIRGGVVLKDTTYEMRKQVNV